MSLGRVIAAVEIIVTVLGSLKLVESSGTLRWNTKAAKLVLYLLVLFRIALSIANLHWAKFSDGGLIIFSSYLLLVILVFYRTDILKTVIVYLLYWFSIMMFQIICLCIICYTHSIVLSEYINEKIGIFYPYYSMHIIGLCFEIACVCLFVRIMKERKILDGCSIWVYVGCVVIIVCEVIIDCFGFDKDMALNKIDRYALAFMLFLMWALASICYIEVAVFKYIQAKYQRNRLDMNMKLLSEQYEFMVQSYEDKRFQLHDMMQRDIMLLGMLEEQQYGEAITYLKERTENGMGGKNRYTGLTTLDIMLDYKISTAEEYRICFEIIADIYDYPLKDNDLCVLVGNLLDNAIEAVKELPERQRQIEVVLKSPNKIFIMEITNPYAGERRKKKGYYLTTKKEDRKMHGIGLRSVEKIVHDYGGDLEIQDSGHMFHVIVTIFNSGTKNGDSGAVA